MLKIVFRTVENENFFGKLISWWTTPFKGKFDGTWKQGYSHVELKFDNHVCYSASQYENTVRAKVIKANEPEWHTFGLNVSYEEKEDVKRWLRKRLGAKYDYLGILGFIFSNVKDSGSRWFCSELCCEALLRYTTLISINIDSADVSPNKLAKLLNLRIKK